MQKTVVTKIDDITGKEFDDGETVTFSFQGLVYEIDLNKRNAAQFRRSVAKYMDKGRRVKATHDRKVREPKHDPITLGKVRRWARANGFEVADRGRVPVKVLEAYESANG